ncbi:MAG: hypothetical protein ABJE10_02135 [bacterium]
MRISHRLYLTMLPAIVGVLLMVALAYYGQYAHVAPHPVLLVGAFVVVVSVVLTWSNARFVARRIERLASKHRVAASVAAGETDNTPDELDQIASVVHRLSSAVEVAETGRAERERAFEKRARDYARLLVSVADASTTRLDDVRLPLHILLENHFGELNENQEEMLGAARTAAEAADADMHTLRQMAELDLGERALRRDRMKPADIIAALRTQLMATAEIAKVTLEFDIAPLLPALTGDRALLQDALTTLFRGVVETSSADSRVLLTAERGERQVRFVVSSDGSAPVSVSWAAAVRVVQAHGGTVNRRPDGLWIELPTEGA